MNSMNSPDKRRLLDKNTRKSWYEKERTFPEGHIFTDEDLISVDMFDIDLDHNLNAESTTSLNPRNQISASHKKIKRFYLPDYSESEDIEESGDTRDNDTTHCKTGYEFRHITKKHSRD